VPAPLLQTKLYRPPPRADLVARPRLLEKLDRGLNEGHQIILVSAPPGYGKTTLVSKWIESQTGPSVWLSLDEADNDPSRFWTWIIRGLETVYEELGKSTLIELGSPQPHPLQWLLSDLLNEIAALNQPVRLVLDDYHVISAVDIHDTLAFVLEHLPQTLQLVLSTRTDPPLPLARLRARDQLTEVRAVDLRFTADEANLFLNQRMGLGLSDVNVAALEERTEGWIAGLHLAALSLQGREPESAARFIATFSGRQHLILDYLTDEVLKRQPEPIQTFLLQTSILNRMSGPLCDAVLRANANSQATLESLEHANLFLVPLDDASQWYRYHHLFAELLRTRLQQAQPERISELHRRAAAWYEDNHFLDEAVAHAFAARDDALAARLLEQVSQAMIMRGEISSLTQWREALPRDLVRHSARLSIDLALVRLLLDEWSAVEPALQDAESTLVDANAQALSLREEVNAMRAIAAIEQGRMVENIEHAADARAAGVPPGID
jgi:LuxR family maltose regulon positive regulatory protein